MSAARAYTYPALHIVAKRPTQAAMFDMVALDTRPFVQTCLPGCGASPANKRAELSQTLAVQVRAMSHVAFIAALYESAAEDIIGLVMRLRVDDMIVCGDWRLELLRFGEGTPFYALYHADVLAGIVDIPVKEDYQIAKYAGLEALQWKLCLCLAVAGCRRDNMAFYEGEARTEIDVHKRDLPYLF
jgi:hypothetical protein